MFGPRNFELDERRLAPSAAGRRRGDTMLPVPAGSVFFTVPSWGATPVMPSGKRVIAAPAMHSAERPQTGPRLAR